MISGLISQCLQPVSTALVSAGIDKSLIDKVKCFILIFLLFSEVGSCNVVACSYVEVIIMNILFLKSLRKQTKNHLWL